MCLSGDGERYRVVVPRLLFSTPYSSPVSQLLSYLFFFLPVNLFLCLTTLLPYWFPHMAGARAVLFEPEPLTRRYPVEAWLPGCRVQHCFQAGDLCWRRSQTGQGADRAPLRWPDIFAGRGAGRASLTLPSRPSGVSKRAEYPSAKLLCRQRTAPAYMASQ